MLQILERIEDSFFFRNNSSIIYKIFNLFVAAVMTVGVFFLAVLLRKDYLAVVQFVVLIYVLYTCGKESFIGYGLALMFVDTVLFIYNPSGKLIYSYLFYTCVNVALIYHLVGYMNYYRDREYSAEIGETELTKDIIDCDKKTGGKKAQAEALRERIKTYNRLSSLAGMFITTHERSQIVGIISDNISTLLGGKKVDFVFLIYDEVNKQFFPVSEESEEKTGSTGTIKIYREDEFDKWLSSNKFTLLIKDVFDDFRFKLVDREGLAFRSLIAIPLIEEEKVIGILRFTSKTANAFDTEDARLLNYLGDICSIAVENCLLYQKTRELAIKDGLTGLFVRRHFIERLEDEIRRAKELNTSFSYLMIDIDHFKECNDTYGHPAGDKVLQQLGDFLRADLRNVDVVGRYGGEEFAVILSDTNLNGGRFVAERLRAKFEKLIISISEDTGIRLTFSIGGVEFKKDMKTMDVINGADKALYSSKSNGRNRVTFWEDIK